MCLGHLLGMDHCRFSVHKKIRRDVFDDARSLHLLIDLAIHEHD
jgi:hypothetical protein